MSAPRRLSLFLTALASLAPLDVEAAPPEGASGATEATSPGATSSGATNPGAAEAARPAAATATAPASEAAAPQAAETGSAGDPAAPSPTAPASSTRPGQSPHPRFELDPIPGSEPLPSLERVLALTRTAAPEVGIGAAQLKSSQAMSVGARRPPVGNPTFYAFAEYGDGVTRDIYVEGQLDMPIEIWGQRGKRIAEAEAFVALSRAGLDVARTSSLAQAIQAYGQVIVALERRLVLRDAITAAHTEAGVYQARVEHKDATLRDARLATMEVARNEVLLVETKADLQDGLAQLQRLTGHRYYADTPPEGSDPPDGTHLLRTAPETSPLVRESRAEASYYDKVLERAAAEGKMPFGVLLRGVRGDMGEARFGGGFSIGIPVFQYNQGERARAAAEAERARNTADIKERSIEAARLGLERELAQLREARHILETMALPAASEAVAAAEEIQRAGKGDLLPVLISRRDYASLRLRRLEILAREWRVVSSLVAITGVEP